MKKVILSFFAIVLILSACSAATAAPQPPPPGEVITTFMTFVKNGEYEEAQALIYEGSPFALDEIEEEYRGIFTNITYEHISETIDGDQAHVVLSINSVDFSAVMEEVMNEAFLWAFDDLTIGELTDRVEALMIEKMVSGSAPTVTNEVTVTLGLHNNQWKIQADAYFADSVTGGMFSFAEYIGQWDED